MVDLKDDGGGSPSADRHSRHLGGRVANSAVLLTGLNFVVRSLSFVNILILARLLVPEDFGLVAMATTILAVIETATDVKTASALIRTPELEKDHFDTAFSLGLLRGVLTALILIVSAYPLARFLEIPELEGVLKVLAMPALISGFSNPYFILYSRNLDFRRDVMRRSIAAMLGSVVAISVAILFRSYWAIVASLIVQIIVNVGLSYWRVPGRPGISLARWREIMGFGIWLTLERIVINLGSRAEYFIIGKAFDAGKLGGYHVANQLITISIVEMQGSFARSFFSAFSMIQDDRERLRATHQKAQATVIALLLPVGFGIGMLSPILVPLLFGPQWDFAVTVLQILAPAAALQVFGSGVNALAMSLNKVRLLTLRAFIYHTFRMALLTAGFLLSGIMGLLVARAVGYGFGAIYNLRLIAMLGGGRTFQPILASWRSILSTFAMTGVLWMLPLPDPAGPSWWELAGVAVGATLLALLVYTGLHLLFWQVAGRPVGAESVILSQVDRLYQRLRRGWSIR